MDADNSAQRFNLEKAKILLVDGDGVNSAIASQILLGFGARHIQKVSDLEEARTAIGGGSYDLIIVDPSMSATGGYEFVSWLRRQAKAPNKFSPVLIVTGHTQSTRVTAARDCGANFVIAKPLSPVVLFDRINWMAREKRPYVECRAYTGPERRFKFQGPPAGSSGRRESDLSVDVGEASAPNMSQADIDALMQPRKVSL